MNHLKRRERRQRIANAIADGELVGTVAAAEAVSFQTVREACREFGVDVYQRKLKGYGTGTSINILAKLFNRNLSFREIASECGVTFQRVGQVYDAAKSAGIPGLPDRVQGKNIRRNGKH